MDIMALVGAFGGGVVGAYLGALPAFIITGLFALVGGIAGALGLDNGFIINTLAFGPFLGPHVAFAGGVAAAAYAGKKGKLENGGDILSALYGLGQADVLCIGGVFGVLGFLVAYAVGLTPLNVLTDLPGITVFILAVVCRLLFGKTGITGNYCGTCKRSWYSGGPGFTNNLVWGLGVGIAVSFAAASMSTLPNWDSISGWFHIICFGFSAFTLIFTQTGFAVPSTHHLTLPGGYAAVVGITAFGPAGALLGVVFAVAAALFGDIVTCSLNSHCDTHIDPPATTIFIFMIIANLVKAAIL